MTKAWIILGRSSRDMFGEREFLVLPTIGSSIAVMDRNAHTHFLEVVGMRQFGWNPTSEVLRTEMGIATDHGIALVCETDLQWQQEAREAD